MKEKNMSFKSLAWIEINLENLENNIKEIQKIIPEKTKIMAVVKANAYGHGLVLISKKLNEIGIFNFAVSSLKEGIELRENGILGNILILGFTDYKNLEDVIKYDLIQTIIDYDYAKRIEKLDLSQKLKVHLKINTGMNRIGENYQNIEKIKEIFAIKNIEILGLFTHLSVSDSSNLEDINFTKRQINNFFQVVNGLKSIGYSNFSSHIQSSYGILNYPELNLDYVRIGIIMYGVHSEKNIKTKVNINLKPVLTLKAKISSIHELDVNESISYGRTYITTSKIKVATVSIGYADGYPRSLSSKGIVLVNGKRRPILGRICMDQLIIDVTNMSIQVGDIVTLIGEDQDIKAEEISYLANTISNELLSRLGNRLDRIIKK